jgi:hypothetical protein
MYTCIIALYFPFSPYFGLFLSHCPLFSPLFIFSPWWHRGEGREMFYLFLQTTPALLRAYTLTWFPEVSTSNLKTSLPVAGIYELWHIFFANVTRASNVCVLAHRKKAEVSCIFFSWLQRTVSRYFFASVFFRQTMPKIFWFWTNEIFLALLKTPVTKCSGKSISKLVTFCLWRNDHTRVIHGWTSSFKFFCYLGQFEPEPEFLNILKWQLGWKCECKVSKKVSRYFKYKMQM